MALSASRATQSRNKHSKRRLPMGVDVIYAGGMVMMNAAGYLMPAAAEASNAGVIGVATETVDNSGGSAGDKRCEIESGDFLFVAASIAVTSNGETMYASDDLTFDETQGSNEPVAGLLIEFVSATSGWIQIGVGLAS